ncbi:MAG: hypothetical protein IJD75_05865 [Clostridia bacterium]|nr:hypothetical protein [Clostridia bacterium]
MMTKRKDFFKSLKIFIKENICLTVLCIVFFLFYRELAGAWLTLIMLAIFVSYFFVMAVGTIGLTKFIQHERSHTLTTRRLFCFSILAAMPIYFLWLVFSLIPIVQYEVWLLIGLPIVIVTAFTLASIADRWKGKLAFYWSLQVAIYLCLLLGGQLIVNFIL